MADGLLQCCLSPQFPSSVLQCNIVLWDLAEKPGPRFREVLPYPLEDNFAIWQPVGLGKNPGHFAAEW